MGISLKGFGAGESGGSGNGASVSGVSALPPTAAAIRLAEPTTGYSVPAGSYWDPTYNAVTASYANSNLDVTITAADDSARTVYSFTGTEKRYWEITLAGAGNHMVGVGNDSHIYTVYPGDAHAWTYHCPNGRTYHNNLDTAYGSAAGAGDIIGVALDMNTGKIWFSVNNVWQGGGNPATGTNPAYTNITGTIYAMVGNGTGTATYAANFGESTFAGTVPDGFVGLDSSVVNLPSTFNSTTFDSTWQTSAVYSNGNLTVDINTNKSARTVDSIGLFDKQYWEVTFDSGVGNFMVGVSNNTVTNPNKNPGGYAGAWAYHAPDGNIYNVDGVIASSGVSATHGSVIGVAIDRTSGYLWFSVNGSWILSGNPSTGANPAVTGVAGAEMYAVVGSGVNQCIGTINPGSSAFTYSVPTGFNT